MNKTLGSFNARKSRQKPQSMTDFPFVHQIVKINSCIMCYGLTLFTHKMYLTQNKKLKMSEARIHLRSWTIWVVADVGIYPLHTLPSKWRYYECRTSAFFFLIHRTGSIYSLSTYSWINILRLFWHLGLCVPTEFHQMSNILIACVPRLATYFNSVSGASLRDLQPRPWPPAAGPNVLSGC